MRKGDRRCQVCRRKATGALVFQRFDFKIGRRFYLRSGAHLCQDHLVEATSRNIVQQHFAYVEDLILAAAKRA